MFDALRGVAIISVVAIHSVNQGYKWRGAAEGAWNFWYSILLRQTLNFAVPLFIFISGWFLAKKVTEDFSFDRDVPGRIRRVALPYLFWSVAIMTVEGVTRKSFDVGDFFLSLLMGTAQGPYYFIILIIELYLLSPLLFRIDSKRWGLFAAIGVNAAALAVVTLARLEMKEVPFSWYALPALCWVGYFQFGIYLARREKAVASLGSRKVLLLCLAALALTLSWGEAFWALSARDDVSWAASAVKLSSFAYSLAAISLLMSLKSSGGKAVGYLARLGDCSFGIFLIHAVYIKHAKALFRKATFVNSIQPLAHAITISLALLFSVATILLARKLLSRKFNRNWLGFY